ncbi:MAG: sulfatase [Desulfobacterales bacterium]|nr:sulfatase [Desulfobacterales bacterium]
MLVSPRRQPMTRREWLKTGMAAGGAALAASAAGPLAGLFGCSATARASRPVSPNVIIIYCDDLGYGDLGCYGSRAIATPNVDRLASQGVRLTDYYACNAVCAPSRAGLLTGRYPFRSGIIGNVYPKDEPFKRRAAREYVGGALRELGSIDLRDSTDISGIPENEFLLGEALKAVGYRTCMVGKWHLGDYSKEPVFNPVKNGFDHYLGVPHSNDMLPCPLFRNEEMLQENIGTDQAKLTGLYTKEAVEFIRESGGKPFFLYFAHTFPHQPLYASEKFAGKSKAGKFGDAVEEIDWSVGRILETLREKGIEENTLIFFTSDNGPWFEGSAGPYRGRKGQSYEGGFHVPMIARWPNHIPAGSECAVPLMNIDLYPTILSVAGADRPGDRVIDGRNILPILTGQKSQSPHEALFYYHYDLLEGVRVGKWKYFRKLNRYVWPVPLDSAAIANRLGGDQLGNRWPLLYNLEIDPGESYNVINTYPDVAEKLEKVMQQWETETTKNPKGWL